MLYQLGHPTLLFGIALALVVGLYVHDATQTAAARLLGDLTPSRQGRLSLSPRVHLEPFGTVAAVVAGYGWGSPVPLEERWRARRYRVAAILLSGPVAYLLLSLLGVALYRQVLAGGSSEAVLNITEALAYTWCAQFVVSLLPLPPLDLGRAILAVAPQSLGWQKTRYQLVDRNLGIVIALAVILLPRLFPSLPNVVGQLAPQLFDALGRLVDLNAVTGTPSL